MSRPITPSEVESEIMRISSLLEHTTDELGKALRTAAQAEVEYKGAYARAVLRSVAKTASGREAEATVECERLLMNRRISEALADSTAEKCRTLRAQLNALQTVSANLRNAWGGTS